MANATIDISAMELVLIVVFVISSLFSMIIPFMYYWCGRCKGHPMNLVAIICLFELISNWNFLIIGLNIYEVESMIGMKKIYNILTFDLRPNTSDESFCKFNDGFFVMMETLIINFNLLFAIDLLITLRKPFVEGRKRQKIYNVIAVVVSITQFIFMVDDLEEECVREGNFLRYVFPKVMSIMMMVFIAVSLLIIIYSTIVLRQKRNQNNTRELYVVHHRRVLISLTVCWLLPTFNNFYTIRKLIIDQSYPAEALQYASFLFLLMTGMWVNIARLSEPHVWTNFIEIWKNLRIYCCSRQNRREKSGEEGDENAGESKIQMMETEETEERREGISEAWNIPLNEALNKFNNQYVLQNIIQAVLQLSKHTNINQLTSTFKMDIEEAEKLLESLNQKEIKQVSRMKKRLELVCVNFEHETETANIRTVFRKNQVPSMAPTTNQNIECQETALTDQVVIKATSLCYYTFQKIRQLDNIDYVQLEESLDVTKNYESIKKTRESLGASGSFFFFSHDKRFVIKTINQEDVDSLVELLPTYYKHFLHEPNSIISKIYGLYTVEIASISNITFILMENSFCKFDRMGIKYRKYDMKGSTVSREVKKPNAQVYKDVNFLKSDDAFIFIKKHEREQLLRQIEKDIGLLAEMNIMDYSLLLGVADLPYDIPIEKGALYDWRFLGPNKPISRKLYSISLIDYLQKFNCQKYLERKYKTFLSTKTKDISSINTKDYYDRFLKFMGSILVVVSDK